MVKGRWIPVRMGRSVQGSLLRPRPPLCEEDAPIPTVCRELGVFFQYEVPAGLSRKDARWALLALYVGALGIAFKEAHTLLWVLPGSLLTMAAWVGIVLAVMVYVVVFHASFLKRHMLHRSFPVVVSHAVALCWSLPIFAAVAIVHPPLP